MLFRSGRPELASRFVAACRRETRPTLIGVGVGPGDPELVTVKAVRILREADLIVVPTMAADTAGRAEASVRAHCGHDRIVRVVLALNERRDRARREAAWEEAAEVVVRAFKDGARTVAFATIGDPHLYSTFTYIAETVAARRPGLIRETVPGITALQALAAASGTVLTEGRESLMLVPLTAGVAAFERALDTADTVVAYKVGERMPAVRAALNARDRLDGAVVGAALGLPGEFVVEAADYHGELDYLATVIVPARRTGRGEKL